MHKVIFIGLLAAMLGMAGISAAQGAQSGPLTVHQLTSTIYWVEGGVGNCGFIVGNKGVIVIDTTVSPASGKALLDHIAKITPKPVTTVILTHGDMDHIGGLAAFPTGITIIAQANTRKRMEDAVAAGGSKVSPEHLPNRAVSTNREDVEIEGVKLELLHWAPAHTDGDLVVYVPGQKIVFTGDIFCMDQPVELIHRNQAGSSEGWLTSAKGVVGLDADRFVVGHGDVQTKDTLAKRISKAEAEMAKIKELVAQGVSLQQIEVAVGDPPSGQGESAAASSRFTPFSEVVYQELTGQKP